MKMKASKILEIANNINALGAKKLPSGLNYALIKNKRGIMAEMECIAEQRNCIIKNYCKKDENGEIITDGEGHAEFEGDNERRATEEYAAFLSTEIDLDIKTVGYEEIEKCDAIEPLTANEMEIIEFMVD